MHTPASGHCFIANHCLTSHAVLRMQQRGISAQLIQTALRYGRTIHARGDTFRVIGRKEVERHARRGIDLSHAEGIHVLVSGDGAVITAYRNHDLRRIRPAKRRHAVHH